MQSNRTHRFSLEYNVLITHFSISFTVYRVACCLDGQNCRRIHFDFISLYFGANGFYIGILTQLWIRYMILLKIILKILNTKREI